MAIEVEHYTIHRTGVRKFRFGGSGVSDQRVLIRIKGIDFSDQRVLIRISVY